MTFTAKMKLLPSLFSSVYSRLKLVAFAMNSRRRYSIFVCLIYRLEEKNSKSEVIFAVCRLPHNGRNKINSSSIQPHHFFKSAVIRSKDLLVFFVGQQTQASPRPTLNHPICNVYAPNFVET